MTRYVTPINRRARSALLTCFAVFTISLPAQADVFMQQDEDSLRRLSEERFHYIEREISELKMQLREQERQQQRAQQEGGSTQEEAEKEKEDVFTLSERLRVKDHLSARVLSLGAINGSHLVVVDGKTKVMTNADYLALHDEQRQLIESQVRGGTLGDLVETEEDAEAGKQGDVAMTSEERKQKEIELARERLAASKEEAKKAEETRASERKSASRSSDYRSAAP